MTIALSPQAQQDLRQLYQQIAQDDPEAADRVLARIVEVIGMLASGGVEGREVHLADGRRFGRGPFLPIESTTVRRPRYFR